ncbi:MAG: sugar phosphate nucleotidyltransferase, partial [Methanocellales archaeon]|nr:sugar phosphate nucleotidyltransferase [Methanocellales archaeon]
MIGMVLCGGHGKRLRPFTSEMPKSLIEIKEGYTILDNQLLGFLSAGIDNVVLLTGHLSEKIKEKYGSEYKGV